jgi:DNA-binding CsgD family transcriptional regulator/tetratricopeptide (TPR) repeat protein
VIKTKSLVERDEHLRALQGAVDGSADRGRVVLVSGEAGLGKTSIVEALIAGLDHRYRLLRAACEPVGIPAAFAPLFELLDEMPSELREDIRSGAGRAAVIAGVLDVLKNDRVVLVIEDIHWADEATLGLIRYLGRRIASTSSTLIVTYRPEELDSVPPLRLVVADLGPDALRVELIGLTVSGVEEMLGDVALDPWRVHTATLGNPFFVEQVRRHPEASLPPTVGTAVLASVDRLPSRAREILGLVALSPEGVDLDLLTTQYEEAAADLDLAVQRLLLVASPLGLVTCRHDLIRETLVESMTPSLKTRIHRRLLEHLEGRNGGSAGTARRAYHSIGAGDESKALRYSLVSAEDAAKAGAHRQSAFHYANALEYASTLDETRHAEVLLAAAKEHCLVNAFETASDLSRRRIALGSGSAEKAKAYAWLSYFESRQNDLAESRRDAEAALGVLTNEAPCEELALAYYVLSWVSRAIGDDEEAFRFGELAVGAAQGTQSLFVEVLASATLGASLLSLGDVDGLAMINEAARIGVEHSIQEPAAKALHYLGACILRGWRPLEARARFDAAIEYTSTHELDAWYVAAVATMAGISVATGRWDDADHELDQVLGQRTCTQTEVETLVIAATLRVRRGDPGAVESIEDVIARVIGSDDYDSLLTACALLMEAAWMGHVDVARARAMYESMGRLPHFHADTWGQTALGYWARRLDFERPQGEMWTAVRLEWDGLVEEAAAKWRERGYVCEAVVTGATAEDADLTTAFSELQRLGAEGVSRGLRRELQRRGVRKIPRGDRPTTRAHPAGLTERQTEVLALIAAGYTNAAIAEELYISEKTAGHHVAAVLSKLNVSSRVQAAAVATSRGWAGGISN